MVHDRFSSSNCFIVFTFCVQIPSTVELTYLMQTKPLVVHIHIMGGTGKTLTVTPFTTVEEVTVMMCSEMKLTFTVPFALYECGDENGKHIEISQFTKLYSTANNAFCTPCLNS